MEKHRIEELSARIGRYTDMFTKQEILIIQKGLTLVALESLYFDKTGTSTITLAPNNTIDRNISMVSVDHGIRHKETKHDIQKSFTYDENQY